QHYMPRPDVLYYGEVDGLSYHLTAGGIHYQMVQYPEGFQQKELLSKATNSKHDLVFETLEQPITIYRVDVNYLGANERAEVVSSGGSSSVSHFYNVPHGAEPALYVRSWQSVTRKDIYTGIDLRYYQGKHGGLESDFVVQPGADYSQIALEISGAELSINERGELVMHTPFGDILEGPVFAHQNGKEVGSHWVVDGDVVRFELVGKVDPSLPLIIDPPVRLYGTYFGGSGDDSFVEVSLSLEGNLIGFGQTSSTTQIATNGAHQVEFGGGDNDCILASYTSEGLLEWATYFGGSNIDTPEACSVHSDGSILVVGESASVENLTSSGAHQENLFGGFLDGFIAKFSNQGILVWGTYFGGEKNESIYGCDVHDDGTILITGSTFSTTNVATPGVFQETKLQGDNQDAFLASFSPEGALNWATYAGFDFGYEIGYACTFSQDASAVMVGSATQVLNGTLASPNAHQTFIPDQTSALVMKFDLTGNVIWSTYYGGSETHARQVAVDNEGNIFIVGSTEDTSYVVTSGAHQPVYGGGFSDGFLAKFSPSGKLYWGTCYGGTSTDELLSCAVSNSGDVIVGGATSSKSGIATMDGYDIIQDGLADGMISRFGANGNMLWGTYYGGSSHDYIYSIQSFGDDKFVVAGTTRSSDAISTPGSDKPGKAGAYDAFFAIFQDETSGLIPAVPVEPLAVTPNPTSGMVYLTDLPEMCRLTVRDAQGVVVLERSVTTNAFDLDLGHLPSGMYILRVEGTDATGIKVARVVVE
ncbi:MAG TPA: T9SS type A sorting domain-containing protein, partial [Saprospiraceae bacterium]|nr:T9SS type A sorting domain-containing protein [Saprospiraceae bacterium]